MGFERMELHKRQQATARWRLFAACAQAQPSCGALHFWMFMRSLKEPRVRCIHGERITSVCALCRGHQLSLPWSSTAAGPPWMRHLMSKRQAQPPLHLPQHEPYSGARVVSQSACS